MALVTRSNIGRLVVGTGVVALLYGALLTLLVYRQYRHESEVSRAILIAGGRFGFTYRGPRWIPDWVNQKYPYLNRLSRITVTGDSHVISEFGSLPYLEWLDRAAPNCSGIHNV